MIRNPYQIVVDTSVVVAGLRSNLGAAFKLLTMLNDFPTERRSQRRWQVNVSVALVLEYEAVLKREQLENFVTRIEVDRLVDDICSFSNLRTVFYQWRPTARDPDDDFVVDLAVECQADFIVTYNLRDLQPATQFGIEVVTPKTFLQLVGEL
jgi:putative PIN family toxin of toxin-antitoxin system